MKIQNKQAVSEETNKGRKEGLILDYVQSVRNLAKSDAKLERVSS